MIQVRRLGKQIGAEILGVDVKTLDDADFAQIYRAWLDANVVVVPGQELQIEDFLRYSRRFGLVVPHPSKSTRHPDYPEITELGVNKFDADGKLVAFVSDRPEGSGGRDIYLYDRATEKLLPLPGLNSVAQEQSPSLSADGRYIVFVSERISGEGERDIFLYDRQAQKLLPTPGLNSKREDIDPFVLTRP